MSLTKRTELRRNPDRGSRDWGTIYQILDAGFLAHVGFSVDGQPFVIPTLYGRDGQRLYLHGSAASRMLREVETGIPTCVTVTLVDGLVLSRSAFDESDYGLPVWAGVLPLEIKSRPPIPDDKLIEGVTLPDYVRRYDARINGRKDV
jgi:hypothetical protein